MKPEEPKLTHFLSPHFSSVDTDGSSSNQLLNVASYWSNFWVRNQGKDISQRMQCFQNLIVEIITTVSEGRGITDVTQLEEPPIKGLKLPDPFSEFEINDLFQQHVAWPHTSSCTHFSRKSSRRLRRGESKLGAFNVPCLCQWTLFSVFWVFKGKFAWYNVHQCYTTALG